MLRELNRQDWLALLGIPEARIPHALLLRGTRNLKTNYEKHKGLLADVIEVGSPNGVFEDVMIGVRGDVIVGYASVYGDAMASEITHVFGALGTRLVLQMGCCGALAEGVLPGDIVCATSAHCGEGAAQYYLPDRKEVEATPRLVACVGEEWIYPVALHKGPIWTTSALLAEGAAEVESWSKQGYIGVDMETASTFAVAEHFSMRRLSVLFAFDSPLQGEHILLTDAEKDCRRGEGEQAMIGTVLSIIESGVAQA